MRDDLLTSVFVRLRPRLFASVRRMLSVDDDAADVLQDAFCRLWGHRDEIRSESHAEGAAVVAGRNAAIDTLRRRRHDSVPFSELPDDIAGGDEDSSVDDALYRKVERIIESRLSARDARVLFLRDRYGYDMGAIASEMNLTESNVRIILSRARRTVRECYRESRT